MSIDWDNLVLYPVHAIFGEPLTAGGEPGVVYQPLTGPAYTLADAIFTEGFAAVTAAGGYVEASSVVPTLKVRLALMQSAPRQGDSYIVRRTGQRYTVKEVQPDGKGSAALASVYAATGQPNVLALEHEGLDAVVDGQGGAMSLGDEEG